MPLPSATAREIYTAAERSIIYGKGKFDSLSRAQQWIRETGATPEMFGFGSASALQRAVWNITRTAKEATDLGSYITQTGYEVDAIPRVPAGSDWTGSIRYRTVVGLTDASGHRRSTLVEVLADAPMSYQDIGSRAIDIAMREQQTSGSPIRGFADTLAAGGASTDVYVLSAGRN